MSEDPRDKPPSPFALTPSAYPPPVSTRHAPVVVPPASTRRPAELSPSPVAAVVADAPADAKPAAPTPAPATHRPRLARVPLLLAAAAGVTLIAALGVWALVARSRSASPAGSIASVAAAPAVESTTATASAHPLASAAPAAAPVPSTTASIASTASAASAASAAASLPAPTKPFDRLAARAALDALTPTLIDCKIASGTTGHIRVAFAPDGNVSSAVTLAPYANTRRGECVATHLKTAHVAPFDGTAPALVYSFFIPR
jgi:hypothetical protein